MIFPTSHEIYVAIKTSNTPYYEQIRRARKEKKWTQKQLAEKLGVTPSYISIVEKGKEVPTIARAKEFAKILKPSINQRALLKKILETQGVNGEDLSFLKKFFTKVKKSFKIT